MASTASLQPTSPRSEIRGNFREDYIILRESDIFVNDSAIVKNNVQDKENSLVSITDRLAKPFIDRDHNKENWPQKLFSDNIYGVSRNSPQECGITFRDGSIDRDYNFGSLSTDNRLDTNLKQKRKLIFIGNFEFTMTQDFFYNTKSSKTVKTGNNFNISVEKLKSEYVRMHRNRIYITLYPNSSLVLTINDFDQLFSSKINLYLYMNSGSSFNLITSNPNIVLNVEHIHPSITELDLLNFESHMYSNYPESQMAFLGHCNFDHSFLSNISTLKSKMTFPDALFNTNANIQKFFLSHSEKVKIIKSATSFHTVYSSPMSVSNLVNPDSLRWFPATPVSFSGHFSVGGNTFISASNIRFGDTYDSDSSLDEMITPQEWRAIEHITPVPRRTIPLATSTSSSRKRPTRDQPTTTDETDADFVYPVVPVDGTHEECLICCEYLADMFIAPCSHRFACNICYAKLTEPKTCSLCQKVITKAVSTHPFCKQRNT